MSDVDGSEVGDRPVIELFVKAAIDKMKTGGCPICHRYFIVFYILRERGMIDLVVTTFLPESPPKEVLDFSNGKHYPLVKVHSGLDRNGHDMTGMECDTVDDIESLLDRFDCDEMRSRKESRAEAQAEQAFEDLYMRLSQFLKMEKNDPSLLIKALERVDYYLRDTESKFLLAEYITRADCYLLPTLQHIRVAGKAYKNFEIPTELSFVWRYLKNAYNTEAFRESCPADREIITHYTNKVSFNQRIPDGKIHALGEDRTFSIPKESVNGVEHDD